MSHSQYTPPIFMSNSFHCPFCHVFSNQRWHFIKLDSHIFPFTATMGNRDKGVFGVTGDCCQKTSYWIGERYDIQEQRNHGEMIWPLTSNAEIAHTDMPDNIKKDFEEARNISNMSPKGAAALLRLAIQKLMKELGEPGKDINTDIKSLVSKGLPPEIQKALDYCRVTGNEAVHPGSLDLDATPEMVTIMFKMINLIIERQISFPRQLVAAYDQLPQTKLDAIETRDGK